METNVVCVLWWNCVILVDGCVLWNCVLVVMYICMTLCIYVYDLGSGVIEIIFLLLLQLILENVVLVMACQNRWLYGINRWQ